MVEYNYEKNSQGVSTAFDFKMDKRTKRFINAIKNLKNPRILEIGMGQGRFLKKISRLRPDAILYGVDISHTAICIAKEDKFIEGTFLVGSAEKIPFQDNFFDAVVIMDVLEHLSNPQQAIIEVKRVLSPSGLFHFYVPCEGQPFTLDKFLRVTNFLNLRDFTRNNFGHIQYFTQKDIKNLVCPYFSKTVITYSDHWISQLFHLLTLYLPKKFISIFNSSVQRKFRSSCGSGVQGKISNLWIVLNKLWLLLLFPINIIYEVEAWILKHLSFTAKGVHFTGEY
jgi:ubiquinone/menaquinone biosynthesis C-methylase UbiE